MPPPTENASSRKMAIDKIMGFSPDGEIKKALIGFVSLLSSGVVSALGFMLIASQRMAFFDQHLATFLILFVQWQTFGLMISKIGIETVVFAAVSSDQKIYFDPRQFMVRTVLPLAGFFSIVVLFVFSLWAAVVSFGSILLDVYSLIIMADLNARGFYKITSISNLLNYPVFFLILFCLYYMGTLNVEVALAVFLFSSLLRWMWLAKKKFIPAAGKNVTCNARLEIGMQQALNYLLFRSDQLILSFLLLKTLVDGGVGAYVYMAKFPEIVSSVMVIAGTVFFPKIYIKHPFHVSTILREVKKYGFFIIGYCLTFASIIYLYRKFWNGVAFPAYIVIPFLLHAVLVIFVNNVTYSMLRQGYVRKMLLNLAISIAVGLSLSLALINGMDTYALSWMVPIQLLSFIALSLISEWGKRTELHA